MTTITVTFMSYYGDFDLPYLENRAAWARGMWGEIEDDLDEGQSAVRGLLERMASWVFTVGTYVMASDSTSSLSE
jgi:hypothetical protein